MEFLRQGTTMIMVGPFLKTSNGYTRSTAEALTTAKVKLSKNDATFANKACTKSSTHSAHGQYKIFLTTADSGTLGRLRVSAIATACLPVWQDYMVTPAEPYNTIFLGTDKLTVDVSTATRAEQAQGAPAANAPLGTKIDFVYQWARNKQTNDGTTIALFADGGAVVNQKRTVSETGGVVTKGKVGSGA
jgi:hypothetical protein